jgi:hypothetical protein
MSHAQIFLKFFPLRHLEPLIPKWNAGSPEQTESCSGFHTIGFHTIDRAWFVGWLALWIVHHDGTESARSQHVLGEEPSILLCDVQRVGIMAVL